MGPIRPAAFPDDLPALNKLFHSAHLSDGHHPIGEHQYLELSAGPQGVAGTVLESDGAIVGYAGLTPSLESGRWTLEIAVEPSFRTPDTFARLIRIALDDAGARGAKAVRVWAFLPRLVEEIFAAGFRPERELRMLQRPLPIDEDADFPDYVTVDRFRPGVDEDEWLMVNNQAFAGHPENGNWTRQVLAYRMNQPWFEPDDLITLRVDGAMAGFCWVKRERRGSGEIYVVAVTPQLQKRGLGKALVVEGLHLMAARGDAKAFLYVDSGNTTALTVYEGLGFRLDHIDRSFLIDL